jgi:DNA-binding Lrp family transcriptional regulator
MSLANMPKHPTASVSQMPVKTTPALQSYSLLHGPLSQTDRSIIAHLQEDGRRPFVTIARDLGISEKTVRNRVQQLLETNVIQIVALTSPEALGYHAGALAGMTLDPAVPASQIAKSLSQLDDVDYVAVTTGRYGLFAEIITRTMASMQQVLEEGIGKIPGIRSVELFPYFSIYYQKAKFFSRDNATAETGGVKATELDAVDQRIVAALSPDGRAPLKNIADALEISETQVRMRINNMIASGQLNIMAIITPMNLENHAVAWIGIACRPEASLTELAEQISGLAKVSYIVICGGRYDMFVEVVCANSGDLLKTLDTEIRKLPGIARTEVFRYMDMHYKRLMPARS